MLRFIIFSALLASTDNLRPYKVVASESLTTSGWIHMYNGPADRFDSGNSVKFDPFGDLVVSGRSRNSDDSHDFYTTKYRGRDGVMIWERRFNGSANKDDQVFSLVVDQRGDVFVGGMVTTSRRNLFSFDTDFYVAKYAAADGHLLWEKLWSDSSLSDYVKRLALDPNGDLFVAGDSWRQTAPLTLKWDFYLAKLSGTNGTVEWEKSYDGPSSGDDEAFGLVSDSEGNALLVAVSEDGSSRNCYVAKYGGTGGTVIWEKRLPISDPSIVVDGLGNAVVVGSSYNGNNSDFLTTKLDGRGTVVWERRFASFEDDFPYSIALDRQGNVGVTGISGRAGSYDFYTAKYAAGDGRVLWEKPYSGPGGGDDLAWTLAFDGDGNLVVAGNTETVRHGLPGYSGFDIYVVKYAAADGSVVWEERYDGVDQQSDQIESLSALDVAQTGAIALTGLTQRKNNAGGAATDMVTLLFRPEPPAPSLSFVRNGNSLTLTWPSKFLGWRLEYQTASFNSGIQANWTTLNGSEGTNQVAVSTSERAGYYRLSSP